MPSLKAAASKVTPARAAIAGTVLIAGLAFSLSFTALTDLAARNGISPGQAWMLPLIVDGLVVVSTLATVAPRGRWYAWALLILGTVVSVAANVSHADSISDGNPISIAIAAIPPIILLAVTHLSILLMTDEAAAAVEVVESKDEPVLVAV